MGEYSLHPYGNQIISGSTGLSNSVNPLAMPAGSATSVAPVKVQYAAAQSAAGGDPDTVEGLRLAVVDYNVAAATTDNEVEHMPCDGIVEKIAFVLTSAGGAVLNTEMFIQIVGLGRLDPFNLPFLALMRDLSVAQMESPIVGLGYVKDGQVLNLAIQNINAAAAAVGQIIFYIRPTK